MNDDLLLKLFEDGLYIMTKFLKQLLSNKLL